MRRIDNEITEIKPDGRLTENQIHIWEVDINDTDLDLGYLQTEILSRDEKNRALRLRSDKDQKRFTVSRAMLRKSLSKYLGTRPREIKFTYNEYGKPDIDPDYHSEKIKFNVSHSHNLTLFAVAEDRRIGIDVEYLRDVGNADKIVSRFFSEDERDFYHSHPVDKKKWAFFTLWTRKEAYSKARGMGIGLQSREFELQLLPGDAIIGSNTGGGNPGAKWTLIDIDVDVNYLAALAIEGNDFEIRHYKPDNIV